MNRLNARAPLLETVIRERGTEEVGTCSIRRASTAYQTRLRHQTSRQPSSRPAAAAFFINKQTNCLGRPWRHSFTPTRTSTRGNNIELL